MKKFMLLLAFLVSITTACNGTPSAVCKSAQHAVQPGETIFQIVDLYCDGRDIMPVVDRLVDLYGTDIRPWQIIAIPPQG